MLTIDFIKEHGLKKFIEETKVIVKEYSEAKLIVLNYNQIESPKNPMTSECRGLILNYETYEVVSRSFDRFFNLGEQPETQKHLDIKKAVVFDKVDGSIIKIYFHNRWEISTRGTAFADSEVNGFGITFREIVLSALEMTEEQFQQAAESTFNKDSTYIFEVTSMENRVVTHYTGRTLWFLAARNNKTGEYFTPASMLPNVTETPSYKFKTLEDCVETAKNLPNLLEGYVIYQDGEPVCKVKSPAYLAVHAIKGEGLTPKRIMSLVLMNEQHEYLTYFPEDKHAFEPYVVALEKLLEDIVSVYNSVSHIEDQKEFALSAKDYCFSSVLFSARKLKEDPVSVFHNALDAQKQNTLTKFMEKNK